MSTLLRLNFFVKLAGAFAVMLAAWLAPQAWMTAAIAALVVLVLSLLRLPGLRGYLKGAAILVVLVVASWLLNLSLQGMPLPEAALTALRMAARLVATTGAFFFVVETSTPGAIMAAASAARLPPTATLVLSLMFGIVPMLRREFEQIADAQRARGLDIDAAPFHLRLRFALARGVPLLVQAVRMAHAISVSLTVSGYDTRAKRTSWRGVGLLVEDRLPRKPAQP
ncbi:energy-coupling factor transporter transmembrane component T family protein [Methylobacterium organophilum]|uniref:Energy-coupling factor transporter transmembrane protein EcfT n=1 Tax=Methylobacterium organophilum TaxID=410 RepID=A0ABQ4T5A1_METOR|nr:energy-coupling factor transporter transmembrane component T [Methylobacterium organophilum]UMY17595.1 energy-coupling factor transporter transmembrane protein EcfT [Methylobacterium organophilum]GJE26201.1 Energy-coupling factor transporter transmembrane protein EcfT [Methylobacterium organophilum]